MALGNGRHLPEASGSRRLRRDPRAEIGSGARTLRGGISGRRFVVAGAVATLVVAAILLYFFDRWKAQYRVRRAIGMTRVVPALDPLLSLNPPGVDPAQWKDAVAATHGALETIVKAGILDEDRMTALAVEVEDMTARSVRAPSCAVEELSGLWDRLGERALFLLDERARNGKLRHPRPALLHPRKPAQSPSSSASSRAPASSASTRAPAPDSAGALAASRGSALSAWARSANSSASSASGRS